MRSWGFACLGVEGGEKVWYPSGLSGRVPVDPTLGPSGRVFWSGWRFFSLPFLWELSDYMVVDNCPPSPPPSTGNLSETPASRPTPVGNRISKWMRRGKNTRSSPRVPQAARVDKRRAVTLARGIRLEGVRK